MNRLLTTFPERKSPVFYYQFFHRGSFSFSDVFGNTQWEAVTGIIGKMFGRHNTNKLGVSHADDCLYLMRLLSIIVLSFSQFNMTLFFRHSTSLPLEYFDDERDYQMSRVMVDLWTNFATFKEPTPKTKGLLIPEKSMAGTNNHFTPCRREIHRP